MRVGKLEAGQVFKMNSVHKILRYSTNTCSDEWARKLAGLTCETEIGGIHPKIIFKKEISNPYGHATAWVYLDSVHKNNFVKKEVEEDERW